MRHSRVGRRVPHFSATYEPNETDEFVLINDVDMGSLASCTSNVHYSRNQESPTFISSSRSSSNRAVGISRNRSPSPPLVTDEPTIAIRQPSSSMIVRPLARANHAIRSRRDKELQEEVIEVERDTLGLRFSADRMNVSGGISSPSAHVSNYPSLDEEVMSVGALRELNESRRKSESSPSSASGTNSSKSTASGATSSPPQTRIFPASRSLPGKRLREDKKLEMLFEIPKELQAPKRPTKEKKESRRPTPSGRAESVPPSRPADSSLPRAEQLKMHLSKLGGNLNTSHRNSKNDSNNSSDRGHPRALVPAPLLSAVAKVTGGRRESIGALIAKERSKMSQFRNNASSTVDDSFSSVAEGEEPVCLPCEDDESSILSRAVPLSSLRSLSTLPVPADVDSTIPLSPIQPNVTEPPIRSLDGPVSAPVSSDNENDTEKDPFQTDESLQSNGKRRKSIIWTSPVRPLKQLSSSSSGHMVSPPLVSPGPEETHSDDVEPSLRLKTTKTIVAGDFVFSTTGGTNSNVSGNPIGTGRSSPPTAVLNGLFGMLLRSRKYIAHVRTVINHQTVLAPVQLSSEPPQNGSVIHTPQFPLSLAHMKPPFVPLYFFHCHSLPSSLISTSNPITSLRKKSDSNENSAFYLGYSIIPGVKSSSKKSRISNVPINDNVTTAANDVEGALTDVEHKQLLNLLIDGMSMSTRIRLLNMNRACSLCGCVCENSEIISSSCGVSHKIVTVPHLEALQALLLSKLGPKYIVSSSEKNGNADKNVELSSPNISSDKKGSPVNFSPPSAATASTDETAMKEGEEQEIAKNALKLASPLFRLSRRPQLAHYASMRDPLAGTVSVTSAVKPGISMETPRAVGGLYSTSSTSVNRSKNLAQTSVRDDAFSSVKKNLMGRWPSSPSSAADEHLQSAETPAVGSVRRRKNSLPSQFALVLLHSDEAKGNSLCDLNFFEASNVRKLVKAFAPMQVLLVDAELEDNSIVSTLLILPHVFQ